MILLFKISKMSKKLSNQALLDRLFSLRVSGARAQKKHTLDQRANEKLNLL